MFTDIVAVIAERGTVGVTELAETLDQPVSTVHGYLDALGQTGWVVNDKGTYRLSNQFLETGSAYRGNSAVVECGREELHRIVQETGMTAYLMVLEGNYGVVVDRYKVDPVGKGPGLGVRTDLTATPAGLAMLAHLPEQRVSQIIETSGSEIFQSNKDLNEELDALREDGYTRAGGVAGVWNVAAPILSYQYRVVGAICMTGPATEMDRELYDDLAPKIVREASNRISIQIDEAPDGAVYSRWPN
jgi:DNA-binding IclR family transcriptional regulator